MTSQSFTGSFVEETSLDLSEDTFRKTFLGSVRERAAMFDVLNAIPQSYTVGMLSNNVPVLCDTVRDDPRMSRFESFVFSNEIGVRKPDAEAFAKLSEALKRPPEKPSLLMIMEIILQRATTWGTEEFYSTPLKVF